MLLVRGSAQRKAARRLRGPPDPASPDTTFAMTDIMDSTKLWEALPGPVMEASVALHNQCLQEAAGECWGYLSFTEGDAFFIVFHTVQDAVRWALLVQERLLQLPWPAELLAHPSGAEEYGPGPGPGSVEGSSRTTWAASSRTVSDTVSSRRADKRSGLVREYEISTKSDASANAPSGDLLGENGRSALLYRGLRVRIGLHANGAKLSSAARNNASSKVVYAGPAPSLCRTVCDAGEGGATLITGSSFAKVSEEFSDAMQPFHCGTYLLPAAETPEGAGHVKEPLVLVEPRPLAGRVHGFSRELRKGTRLSPHCLDAPPHAPLGDVAIVFASVPAADSLKAALGEVGTEALCQVNHLLREALDRCGGYEVSATH